KYFCPETIRLAALHRLRLAHANRKLRALRVRPMSARGRSGHAALRALIVLQFRAWAQSLPQHPCRARILSAPLDQRGLAIGPPLLERSGHCPRVAGCRSDAIDPKRSSAALKSRSAAVS